MVHDLRGIDLLVVRGDESDVDALGVDYDPDSGFSFDLPVDDEAPITVEEASAEVRIPATTRIRCDRR